MLPPLTASAPLSPVFLAGLIVQDLPLAPLQRLLGAAMRITKAKHPGIFDRLLDYTGQSVGFDPVDLPFCFCLQLDEDTPKLQACRSFDRGVKPVSVVRGTLLSLLDLLQGRVDGDALFFSRELVIEGDTELVLALRNAVDAAEIDLVEDFVDLFGPLKRGARALTTASLSVHERLQRDLQRVSGAIMFSSLKSAEKSSANIAQMKERIDELERRTR